MNVWHRWLVHEHRRYTQYSTHINTYTILFVHNSVFITALPQVKQIGEDKVSVDVHFEVKFVKSTMLK